jgi:integrase
MSQALGNQRRVRGTGGISKRKMVRTNGSAYFLWQGTVAIDGKRRTIYGHGQAEVAAKIKALQSTPAAPVAANGKLTVAEYLNKWLDIVCATIAPQTCRSYRMFVRVHLIPAIGNIKLAALTSADVAKMLRNAHVGRSPRTVSTLRVVLQGALKLAVEDGLIPRNVAAGKGAGVPRQVAKAEPIFVTPTNVQRLLDAAIDDRLRALYMVAVNIGARQGELLGLLWSDVDFDHGTIAISRQLQRVGGSLVLQPLKTKRSRRTLYMGADVAAGLQAHRERQSVEREQAGKRWQSEPDFVFRSESGKGHDGVQVTKEFQRIVRAAKLPAMRFHDLRHTSASIRLHIGESLLSVSRLLGHSTIAVTANVYGHLLPESGRDAADKMGKALAS